MQSIESFDKYTTTDFNVLDTTSSYANLINLYDKRPSQIIFVEDKKKGLQGYISLDKILKTGFHTVTDKNITVKLPFIREFDLNNIIKVYLDNNIPLIPVVNQKNSIEYVLNIFKIAKEYLYGLEFPLEDLIEEIPLKVKKDDKIDFVMSQIKKSFITNIPVVEQNKIIGFIDAKKLITFLFKPEKSDRSGKSGIKQSFEGTIESLISEKKDIVLKKQDTYTADLLLELMDSNFSENLFIVDKENNLVGMVKLRKLINSLFFSLKKESENIKISILSAPDDYIEQIAKKKISNLIEKHSSFYKEEPDSECVVRFHKIENQSQKGRFRYETDMRISFGKGKDAVFTVTTDDWGANKSFAKAFVKISRLITDKGKINRQNYQQKDQSLY